MTRSVALGVSALLAIASCGSREAAPRRDHDAALVPADAAPPPSPSADELARMAHVPAGDFIAVCIEGFPWDGQRLCTERHFGITRVFIDEFYLDKTEVTVAEYRACVVAGACTEPVFGDRRVGTRCDPAKDDDRHRVTWGRADRDDHPINCLLTKQAAEYCAWRNKHLPTTKQWEKAARGVDGAVFPWGNERPTCQHAAIDRDSTDRSCGPRDTRPVGTYPEGATPHGILDLVGNVAEMATDLEEPREAYRMLDPRVHIDGLDESFTVSMGGHFERERDVRGGLGREDRGAR
jgi:formylglycine-generating enzyme required for sulfatase activity